MKCQLMIRTPGDSVILKAELDPQNDYSEEFIKRVKREFLEAGERCGITITANRAQDKHG